MRNKNTKTALFSAVCISSFILLFIMIYTDNSRAVPENSDTVQSDYYIVSEYEGKIAVFKNEEKFPLEIYDSFTAILPDTDRELLKNGIIANSTEELQKIIEDYTS
ncbi:MAG: hypothetical protein J1F23_02905 [Oscillospiraceae bacterium]|nr:hypothetical protein [Oscillospiraceae bacterium]